MRRAVAVVTLALGLAAPAFADTVDVLKANTLVLRAQDGGATVLLVKDDGKLEQVNARGLWAAGFWSLQERGFCWTARGASEVCIALAADKTVGDRWEIAGPTGKVVWTAEIQPGRADLKAVAAGIKASLASGGAGEDHSGH